MTADLPRGCHSRNSRGGTFPYEICSSADQAIKIKRLRYFTRSGGQSLLAAKTSADIAPELKADIRVGIITKIHAAEIKRASGEQIGTSVLRIGARRRGCGRGLLVLALLGGIGGRREHESRSQGGSEDFEWKRHGDPLTMHG